MSKYDLSTDVVTFDITSRSDIDSAMLLAYAALGGEDLLMTVTILAREALSEQGVYRHCDAGPQIKLALLAAEVAIDMRLSRESICAALGPSLEGLKWKETNSKRSDLLKPDAQFCGRHLKARTQGPRHVEDSG